MSQPCALSKSTPKWKLLANVKYGNKAYLFVKNFDFMHDLRHEMYLLANKKHDLYPEGISDRVWILSPDNDTEEVYVNRNGRLHLESCVDEEADDWSY